MFLVRTLRLGDFFVKYRYLSDTLNSVLDKYFFAIYLSGGFKPPDR